MSIHLIQPILAAVLLPILCSSPTLAAPTVTIQQEDLSAQAPDWSRWTFASLPSLSSSGKIGDRTWRQGQPITQVVRLGDFQGSLQLQNLNFYAIATGTEVSPATVKLSAFKLFRHQSLADLATALPELAALPLGKAPILKERLQAVFSRPALDRTLAQAIAVDPMLGTITFSNFDLSRYSLMDVPGLLTAPFQRFQNWQSALISDIPGLDQLPWNLYPTVLPTPEQIVKTRVVAPNAVQLSGDDTGIWKVGVENGKPIFGSAFAIALTKASEQEIKTALFFRACQPSPLDRMNCLPYRIGPISFVSLKPGEAIAVGVKEVNATVHPLSVQQLHSDVPTPKLPLVEPVHPSHNELQNLTQNLWQFLEKVAQQLGILRA